ncbi:hypothetical protein B0T24DRAFT_588892 [Lasiosphaeria ovina]|uniref:Nuclear transport factor 2 n=1 Tax=Lasiosphaeria ovina TaxID=92902 RepID=A0AAE0TYP8_9PEZI|nr:hypothetical protein B0T24DRAFT_588892 [Lasiosphaeria ovina]
MADFNLVATQFVGHYYSTFDSNRAELAGLYSAQELGAAAIAQKLVNLPFEKVKHQPVTTEAQPTPGGGIVILVTGQLLVDDEQNPLSYSQAFQLSKDQAGNWYVFNDIFTLV